MVLLKVLTVLFAGIVSLFALRHMMRSMEAQKVRVRTGQKPQRHVTRLRQDPRTGVYYPEG
jgi:hypothetical protein